MGFWDLIFGKGTSTVKEKQQVIKEKDGKRDIETRATITETDEDGKIFSKKTLIKEEHEKD